jgi:hypothetical protein
VLCSAALLATFLATWLKAVAGSKYLFGRLLVQSSSLAWFFVFGLFVRECRSVGLQLAPLYLTAVPTDLAPPLLVKDIDACFCRDRQDPTKVRLCLF